MDGGRDRSVHDRNGEASRLVGRMARARTEGEIGGAERVADAYLRRHPDDLDVLVAREALARKAAQSRDPERRANRWGLAAFAAVAVVVALVLWWYAGAAWAVAAAAGLLLAGEFGEAAWHALRDEGRRGGRGQDG